MNDNIINCWNSIGVWGKEKPRCPVLDDVIHCQNCEKYISAGRQALKRKIYSSYEETQDFSSVAEETRDKGISESVMVVRIGDEWFALPSRLCEVVTEDRPIHTIPHQNNALIKGVVNIAGEVNLCFSLGSILGVKVSGDAQHEGKRQLYNCLIVMTFENNRFVFPVSEFKGLYNYFSHELTAIPSTIKTNSSGYLNGIIKWNNLNIGCINADILFSEIERGIQ